MSKKKRERVFQPRVPIPVRGGIKAQIGRSVPQSSRKWWVRKWLACMESLQMGARLGRGRGYALAGQVTSLDVTPGVITAYVQGSGSSAYKCELKSNVVAVEAKKSILTRIQSDPFLIGQLLVHNLPEKVDTFFRAAGYPLIPTDANPLITSCTCPDYANPCKHLAAVYFIVSEAIEHDPLILLELRGISRADIVGGVIDETKTVAKDVIKTGTMTVPFPSSDTAEFFWDGPGLKRPDYGKAPVSEASAPLIRRLGTIPFWRGEQRFLEAMEQCASRINGR